MGIGLHAFKSRLKSYKNVPWRNTKTWGLNISKQMVKIIGTLKNQGFKLREPLSILRKYKITVTPNNILIFNRRFD